jgi:hypothetical protein
MTSDAMNETAQKKNPNRIQVVVAVVFGGLAAVAGPSGVARADGPAAAGLPKEVKDMSCLVGSWKGTGSMTMNGQKADGVKITWTCKRTSSEWGV